MKLGIHGLPLRSAEIARRRRRLHLVVAVLGLGIFGFIAAVGYTIWPQRAEVVATLASRFSRPAPQPQAERVTALAPARPVYRHSIVPGGAYSQRDVADAVRRDDVVAAHYQSIDVDRVRPTTVKGARAAYVSYRMGNQVYWTKRPVPLAPGETLLTDGTSEIRARCGNLVSDHAQQPVAAEEPPLALLDETETGDSSMAEARTDPGGLSHVPFLQAWNSSYASGNAPDGAGAASAFPPAGPHMWAGGNDSGSFGGGSSHASGAGSHVTMLGSGERGGGGGKDEVPFLPPGDPGGGTTTGSTQSTTGGTTGSPTGETTGFTSGGTTGTTGETTGTTTTGQTGTTTGTTSGEAIGNTTGVTTGGTTTGITTGIAVDTTGHTSDDGEVPSVPEPATLTLLGLGACGVVARVWRSRRS